MTLSVEKLDLYADQAHKPAPYLTDGLSHAITTADPIYCRHNSTVHLLQLQHIQVLLLYFQVFLK